MLNVWVRRNPTGFETFDMEGIEERPAPRSRVMVAVSRGTVAVNWAAS